MDFNLVSLEKIRRCKLGNEIRIISLPKNIKYNLGEIWRLDSSEDEWTPRKNFLELFLEFGEIPFFFFF